MLEFKLNKSLLLSAQVRNKTELWEALKGNPQHLSWRKKLGLEEFFEASPFLMLSSFTHTSFFHEHSFLGLRDNERLEFLGDALLDAEISFELWRRFPEMKEGELSRFRSSLVNEDVLAQWGEILGLENIIFLGRGEAERKVIEKAIVADTFEAILGAIGLIKRSEVRNILSHWIEIYESSDPALSLFSPKRLEFFDPKTKLQELTLDLYQELPRYENIYGEDNFFECTLFLKDSPLACERGKSKKRAEIKAARSVLMKENYKNLKF